MWRAIRILRTVLWTCERLAKRPPKEWSWGQGAGQYLKTQQIKGIPGGEPEGEEESHLSWLKIEGKVHWSDFPFDCTGNSKSTSLLPLGYTQKWLSHGESKHIFPATKETHINHLLQPRSLSPININYQPDLQISEGNWYQEGQRPDLQMGSHLRRCGTIKSNSETLLQIRQQLL